MDSNLPAVEEERYSTKRSIPYAVVPVAEGSKMTLVGVTPTAAFHGFPFVFPKSVVALGAMFKDESVPFRVPPWVLKTNVLTSSFPWVNWAVILAQNVLDAKVIVTFEKF